MNVMMVEMMEMMEEMEKGTVKMEERWMVRP